MCSELDLRALQGTRDTLAHPRDLEEEIVWHRSPISTAIVRCVIKVTKMAFWREGMGLDHDDPGSLRGPWLARPSGAARIPD